MLGAEKAHKTLAHKALSGHPMTLVAGLPRGGTRTKIIVFLGFLIAHKSLTPEHPTRRLPSPPPTRWSPAKKIYVNVPFSFLSM